MMRIDETRRIAALKVKLNVALALGILALLISVAGIGGLFDDKKIAYVQSDRLVNEYMGMKESRNLFQGKADIWQANIDTLQSDFTRALETYQNEFDGLTQKERKEREESLYRQEKKLVEYKQVMEQQAKEEDLEMTQGVLNQINSFVETYGDENGYDIILGTTYSGNLLYGRGMLDITDELLKALNKSYNHQPLSMSGQ